MILVTAAVAVYWINPAGNPGIDMAALMAIGFLIYGPVMLIGLQALDLVPKKAAGTAAGLTGLFGYFGGAFAANIAIGAAVDRFGWDGGFWLLFGSCLASVVLFARGLAEGERQQERLTSSDSATKRACSLFGTVSKRSSHCPLTSLKWDSTSRYRDDFRNSAIGIAMRSEFQSGPIVPKIRRMVTLRSSAFHLRP